MSTLASYFVGSPHPATLSTSGVHVVMRMPAAHVARGGDDGGGSSAPKAAARRIRTQGAWMPLALPGLLPRYLPGVRVDVSDVTVDVPELGLGLALPRLEVGTAKASPGLADMLSDGPGGAVPGMLDNNKVRADTSTSHACMHVVCMSACMPQDTSACVHAC
eukprot:352924-Chlamydomonas_euryale.AAC.2